MPHDEAQRWGILTSPGRGGKLSAEERSDMFDVPIFSWRLSEQRAVRCCENGRAEAFLRAHPSGKIRLAINDLEMVEHSARYAIDMETWHAPDNTNRLCHVCFAGAVMANRHAIQPHQTYVGPFVADGPNEYSCSDRWDELFGALDEFRTGYVEAFLSMDGTVPKDKVLAFAMTQSPVDPFGCFPGHVHYEDDPEGFKAWARDIAAKLDALGW